VESDELIVQENDGNFSKKAINKKSSFAIVNAPVKYDSDEEASKKLESSR